MFWFIAAYLAICVLIFFGLSVRKVILQSRALPSSYPSASRTNFKQNSNIICPNCGETILPGTTKCTNCNTAVSGMKNTAKVVTVIAGIIIFSLMLIVTADALTNLVKKPTAEPFPFEEAELEIAEVKTESAPEEKHGTIDWRDGTYSGDLKNGIPHGTGTFSWPSGATFYGAFINGERTGQGTYEWADGTKYVGAFIEGKRTGQGTLTWLNGDTYTGDFVDGDRTGQGRFTWTDGRSYVGDFVDGELIGQGTFTWADGSVYVGELLEGNRHGQGTLTSPSGVKYIGGWKNDVFHGKATVINTDGRQFHVEHADGRLITGGEAQQPVVTQAPPAQTYSAPLSFTGTWKTVRTQTSMFDCIDTLIIKQSGSSYIFDMKFVDGSGMSVPATYNNGYFTIHMPGYTWTAHYNSSSGYLVINNENLRKVN